MQCGLGAGRPHPQAPRHFPIDPPHPPHHQPTTAPTQQDIGPGEAGVAQLHAWQPLHCAVHAKVQDRGRAKVLLQPLVKGGVPVGKGGYGGGGGRGQRVRGWEGVMMGRAGTYPRACRGQQGQHAWRGAARRPSLRVRRQVALKQQAHGVAFHAQQRLQGGGGGAEAAGGGVPGCSACLCACRHSHHHHHTTIKAKHTCTPIQMLPSWMPETTEAPRALVARPW